MYVGQPEENPLPAKTPWYVSRVVSTAAQRLNWGIEWFSSFELMLMEFGLS